MSQNLFDAHVQWANRPADQRFQTLDSLYDAVASRRLRSHSVDVTLGSIKAEAVELGDSQQTIVLNSGLKAVEPSHWSFGQLGTWIHAPVDYLRRLSAPLAVQCINEGIRKEAQERGELKFMTVSRENDEDAVNTLQAITSTSYGRIWDADCVKAVQKIAAQSGGTWHNPPAYDINTGQQVTSGLYASDRDVFMFLIDGGSFLEAGPRDRLNRGFIVSNSEVGARSFRLQTFLHRGVCGNHIIWGASDVRELKIIHSEGGPSRFLADGEPALRAYVNSSAAPELAAIKRAQEALLIPSAEWSVLGKDEREKALVQWFRERKFSGSEARESIASARKEEGDCRTLWQAVQGLTAYARSFDFVDARVDLETRAGKLLDAVKN